mmetsp:Transcript_20213/g.30116  ORF Transcript_20213/g.30116 Transcript_20213/m.30116 type:complete len:282 (+) Transcript_20213:1139-1984(+)
MDGEVVHALFRLLDEGLAEDFPVQIFSDSVDLFEGLVDWHGTHWNGGVAHDPLTSLVDVLSGTQVHERVGSPEGGPLEFLDFFFDGAGHCGISNVSIDLDFEHATNNLRLELQMVLIAANNGTPSGNLRTNKLRLDALTFRHEQHLLGNHTLARKVHLSVTLVVALTLIHPLLTNLGNTLARGHALRSTGIVHVQIWLIFILQRNATEGDLQDMTSFLVRHNLVFLGGAGESIIVRDSSDRFEIWIVRIKRRFGSTGGFDVGFRCDQIFERIDGLDQRVFL